MNFKLMGFQSPMCTDFWTVEEVPSWAPPGCYLPLILLIPFLKCIWAVQIWMFVTLFLAFAAISVARFLAIRVGHVAIKLYVPIMVNCLIDLP